MNAKLSGRYACLFFGDCRCRSWNHPARGLRARRVPTAGVPRDHDGESEGGPFAITVNSNAIGESRVDLERGVPK